MLFFILCGIFYILFFFFFSSRRRHTRSLRDWSSDVCSSDLAEAGTSRWLPVDREPLLDGLHAARYLTGGRSAHERPPRVHSGPSPQFQRVRLRGWSGS